MPGFQSPVKVSDVTRVSGRNKGIQGHQNSCYLDATLFAMFSFTGVFDGLLYRPQTVQDIPEYTDVQRVLREEIVNPLRKKLFVRADKVMRLRRLLDDLTSVRGLTSEEKGTLILHSICLFVTSNLSRYHSLTQFHVMHRSGGVPQLIIDADAASRPFP